MKKFATVLSLLMMATAYGQGTLGHYEYNVRCANYEPAYPNGLASDQAPGRQDYGIHCSKTNEDITFIVDRLEWQNTNGQMIPMYPVFGVPQYKTVRGRQVRAGGSNPKNLSFPIRVADDQNCHKMPEDYHVVAMCRSSCFTKTVAVLTPEGFRTAENFHADESLGEVISITQDSKIGNVTTESRKVAAKVASLVEGKHEIFVIKTETGKIVKVTPNHPLVSGTGHFVIGGEVKEGSTLLNEFGEAEQVISVEKKDYFGKVYNVALDGRKGSYTDKVFVLEGLLSGDADIQNDDIAKVNRALNKWINTPEEI